MPKISRMENLTPLEVGGREEEGGWNRTQSSGTAHIILDHSRSWNCKFITHLFGHRLHA